MEYNSQIHHRRSIRLKGYDYSQNGAYFVTICTQNTVGANNYSPPHYSPRLGEITNCGDKKIVARGDGHIFAPTKIGKIAEECWLGIPKHYPNVILDEYVIMPNHVHGILFIDNEITRAVGANNYSPPHYSPLHYSPLRNDSPPRNSSPGDYSHPPLNGTSKTIGAIVRGYKIGVTKWARANTDIYAVWQRNYHEHIIRDENSLNKIREYIINNPDNWHQDELFFPPSAPTRLNNISI